MSIDEAVSSFSLMWQLNFFRLYNLKLFSQAKLKLLKCALKKDC